VDWLALKEVVSMLAQLQIANLQIVTSCAWRLLGIELDRLERLAGALCDSETAFDERCCVEGKRF